MADTPVSVRLDPDIVQQLDDLISMVESDPELAVAFGGRQVTRTHVLRLALVHGIPALRAALEERIQRRGEVDQ